MRRGPTTFIAQLAICNPGIIAIGCPSRAKAGSAVLRPSAVLICGINASHAPNASGCNAKTAIAHKMVRRVEIMPDTTNRPQRERPLGPLGCQLEPVGQHRQNDRHINDRFNLEPPHQP